MVLGTLYMVLEGLRSADVSKAYVSCEERWASPVRMAASVGSLNCYFITNTFCEHLNAAAGVGPAVCWWSFPKLRNLTV